MIKFFTIIFLCISTFAFCQNVSYGTTIITHGYQLSGEAPININDNSAWVLNMANAILERAGNQGCICIYNKLTGNFDVKKGNCGNGETILLYDWGSESNNLSKGFTEASGDALFASLIMGYKNNKFSLTGLHFIGHSRGTIVNSEAIERLLSLKKTSSIYSNSISINQVTNLDPHDWGWNGVISDYDNHPNLNIPCPQNRRPNNGTIAWKGSGFNDSYYQIGNISAILDGRPVDGTFNCDWSKIAIGHSEVHRVYIASIRDFSVGNSTPCQIGGYRLSRIGGASRPNEDNVCDKQMIKYSPEFDFLTAMKIGFSGERIRGIMNGGFDRGDGINIPGWEEHNGATKTRRCQIINGTLSINAYPNQQGEITHNRLYVPIEASFITFERKYNSDYAGKFTILINGNSYNSKEFDKRDNDFVKECIDVSTFQDKIITLSFLLENTSPVFSDIIIDNVKLSATGCKNNSTLFLFDLSGSMNGNGANSNKSKLQQAKDASKATLNSLRNNNSGIPDEVAVLGFSGGCTSDPTTVVSKFETDLALVESRIDAMGAGGGTPLAEAIAASECKLANHLAQTGQNKGKLIILSDGQATCQPIRPNGVYNSGQLGQQIVTVSANQCGGSNIQQPNIKYYTIGFNIGAGSPAERDLQYLAQISGGKYLNVQSQTQLERAFRKFNRTYIPKPNPALSNLPSNSNSQFDKGVSQINSESFTSALETYQAFAGLHADDCHGAYNLALMQEANDFYKKAIANYQKYLSLCPNAPDKDFVEKQILFLEEEFKQFLLFQKEVIKSDLEYLKLHFEKIQNGQSVALAEEFKGFLKEKGDYYINLPELMGRTDRLFKKNSKEVADGLDNCAKTINRNPETWDRDATPVLSMTYLNLERLLNSL